MPIVRLTDRALVTVAGPDAEHLLQNVITTDLDALKAGEMKPGALLTPQGKILFDFLVSRAGEDGLRLDVRADIAADFAKRLTLYKLRAKAEIIKQDQVDVAVAWENDSTSSENDS
ncbi:MAG: folate-binding protein, partial [Hyphomicrobiales bacterium]|nr:folate-binding protein [Hyphomicrobiales bacterium]